MPYLQTSQDLKLIKTRTSVNIEGKTVQLAVNTRVVFYDALFP